MYSAQLLDHFEHPRNSGELPDADAHVRIENPACGDILELTIKMDAGRIAAIGFRAKGCVPAMACASAVTELAKGKSANDALAIGKDDDCQFGWRLAGGLRPRGAIGDRCAPGSPAESRLSSSCLQTQHRPAFVYVPLRSCSRPAGDQRPHRIREPACDARVPPLLDGVKECRRKRIARSDRIRHFHFEARNLTILAVMKKGTATLAKGDADDFAPVLLTPAAAELLDRRTLSSSIEGSIEEFRLAVAQLYHVGMRRQLLNDAQTPVAVA